MSSWAEKLRTNLPSTTLQNNNNSNYSSKNVDVVSTRSNNNINNKRTNHRNNNSSSSSLHSSASPLLLLSVFHFLSARDLALKCAQVCHQWRNLVHEPIAWDFAWKQYLIDVETGFGRSCYDPLPQLLRLAGFSNPNNNNSSPSSSSDAWNNIATKIGENSNATNQNQNQVWESLQARGGPSLLTEDEIAFVFSASSKRHCSDDRYKAIVRSGAYRLRYILSLLIHSHELRRDLGFEEGFGHYSIAKNYLRRRFLSSYLSQKRKEQRRIEQERQRRRELLEGRDVPASTNTDENENQQQQPVRNSSQTTTPTTTPPISPALTATSTSPAAPVFKRNKTKRVRCLTFVDRIQWQEWLGATQEERRVVVEGKRQEDESQNQNGDDGDEYYEEEEEEDYYEGEEDDDDLFASSSAMLAFTTYNSKDTVGSLTALETLQTLRSCPSPSVTQLSGMQMLNIFSHLHAGAELSASSIPVSIVDSTDCVDIEDDEILTDIAALILGELPYVEETSAVVSNTRQGNVSKRVLRLVELTLTSADTLIKTAATRAKEKEGASKIFADFALRPLSRYVPPCALDQVDWTMRSVGVGRSTTGATNIDIIKSTTQSNNNIHEKKWSFLNSGNASSSSTMTNNRFNNENEDDDAVFEEEQQQDEYYMPSTMLTSELSLSECLSLLCAPKFFSGPELCQEHSISVLAVDPLRLCLIKLKS